MTKAPLGKTPLIDVPFKRVAIDLTGPICLSSEQGHRYILMLVDYATLSRRCANEIYQDIYSRLGIPEEILSDVGAQFVSE